MNLPAGKCPRIDETNLSYTAVADILPLQGLPLLKLYIGATQVSDLTQLKGMPLTDLCCGGTNISDLSPLQGMALTELRYDNNCLADLSPLKSMPLRNLHFEFRPERDTELLQSIRTLETINGKDVGNFWTQERVAEMAVASKDLSQPTAKSETSGVSLVDFNRKYLTLLVDWTGRENRVSQQGATHTLLAPLFDDLGNKISIRPSQSICLL